MLILFSSFMNFERATSKLKKSRNTYTEDMYTEESYENYPNMESFACKHKVQRFVVNAPIQAYTDHRINENGIPFGYVCTCTSIGHGQIFGENIIVSTNMNRDYNEISNAWDLFSPLTDSLKVIIENGKILIPKCGNDVPKEKPPKRKGFKSYQVKLCKKNKRKTSVPVSIVRKHLLDHCGNKCKLCLNEVEFDPSYTRIASSIKNESASDIDERRLVIIDEDGATSDDLEIARCLFLRDGEVKEEDEEPTCKKIKEE